MPHIKFFHCQRYVSFFENLFIYFFSQCFCFFKNDKQRETTTTSSTFSSLQTRRSLLPSIQSDQPKFICSNCKSDCSKLRFQSKDGSHVACPNCYSQGFLNSADTTRISGITADDLGTLV